MVAKSEHHLKSGCPVACALDIIGDHWTLLIVRDLMFLGRHEYKDMLASEEGISSNILSDRLRKLERAGVVASAPHPQSRRRKLYYLTDKGKDLIHVMLEIARWSDRHLADRVFTPEESRALLDGPAKEVTADLMRRLKAWEDEFLG